MLSAMVHAITFVTSQQQYQKQPNCMYRLAVYKREHQNQLLALADSGYIQFLTIPSSDNPYYLMAKFMTKKENQVLAELVHKEDKKYIEYVYLIVALKLTNQSYHGQISNCKARYPSLNLTQLIDEHIDYFSKMPAAKFPQQSKQNVHYYFQKLQAKAESEGYFKINEVPAFLISTSWLEHLYIPNDEHPPAIANQSLVEISEFLINDCRYHHYNYKIREDIRENQHFKLIAYEAWAYLHSIYGGLEVKRFTTKQKDPVIDTWYSHINILLVEQRCVIYRLQLQISKYETFQQFGERIRIILKDYKIVPESYYSRPLVFFKSKELQVEELVNIIQNDDKEFVHSHHLERIGNPNIQFQEANIYATVYDVLVVNIFKPGQPSIFAKIPLLKVVQIRDRCLSCGSTIELTQCKCKSVYFCSKFCRETHNQHLKECNTMMAETRKHSMLVDAYKVNKRNLAEFDQYLQYGMVGMQNLGNTCYMNAALQCILRIFKLAKYFMSNDHLDDINVNNNLGSEGHLACAFGELVKDYYTTRRKSLEPSSILRIIQKNPQFRGYNHQDSQQFLNYFLDKLHEDLNKVKNKPYLQDVESNGRPDEVVSKLSWSNYKKRNDSFVSSLLAGQYRSQISCPDCQKISITFDPFMSVTLQFPKEQKTVALQGFYMTQDGQFKKVYTIVKVNTLTGAFFQRAFEAPVQAVYQIDKRIVDKWDQKKTVFANKKDKGVLFFFSRQSQDYNIEVNVEIYNQGKAEMTNFTRQFFMRQITSVAEIKNKIYSILRYPVENMLKQKMDSSQYYALCEENDFINIMSIQDDQRQVKFPIKGPASLTCKIQVFTSRMPTQNVLKLNTSNGTYDTKEELQNKKRADYFTVPELLETFINPQTLTEDNAWYCNACKSHKLADKKMSLHTLPEFLIIHLKRFNHRGDSGNRYIIYGEKVNTSIALEQFEIINGIRYELVGMVNHTGSLTMGHYTALVKRDEWLNYDDGRCYKDRLNGKNAYLLFYQKAEAQ